jgi:hypothetical protein
MLIFIKIAAESEQKVNKKESNLDDDHAGMV